MRRDIGFKMKFDISRWSSVNGEPTPEPEPEPEPAGIFTLNTNVATVFEGFGVGLKVKNVSNNEYHFFVENENTHTDFDVYCSFVHEDKPIKIDWPDDEIRCFIVYMNYFIDNDYDPYRKKGLYIATAGISVVGKVDIAQMTHLKDVSIFKTMGAKTTFFAANSSGDSISLGVVPESPDFLHSFSGNGYASPLVSYIGIRGDGSIFICEYTQHGPNSSSWQNLLRLLYKAEHGDLIIPMVNIISMPGTGTPQVLEANFLWKGEEIREKGLSGLNAFPGSILKPEAEYKQYGHLYKDSIDFEPYKSIWLAGLDGVPYYVPLD